MTWDVELTARFEDWWNDLAEDEQISVAASVELLEIKGPTLGRPHVDTVQGSVFANMKELRVQHRGRPYRVLFAFDPRRTALLLLGGDKTGDARWYRENVPVADQLFREHLVGLERER